MKQTVKKLSFTENETNVFNALNAETTTVNQLAEKLNKQPIAIRGVLVSLERKGAIKATLNQETKLQEYSCNVSDLSELIQPNDSVPAPTETIDQVIKATEKPEKPKFFKGQIIPLGANIYATIVKVKGSTLFYKVTKNLVHSLIPVAYRWSPTTGIKETTTNEFLYSIEDFLIPGNNFPLFEKDQCIRCTKLIDNKGTLEEMTFTWDSVTGDYTEIEDSEIVKHKNSLDRITQAAFNFLNS